MNIVKSTESYEQWLRAYMPIVESDLAYKHDQMASAVFPFFRATYYRWAQVWAEVCGKQADSPEVLAVGDLHAENFGTWRDAEGRLVWGVNDFDEASHLPYANDLIRLGTSLVLAAQERANVVVDEQSLSESLIEGYRKGLEDLGRPFVLAEHHVELRRMATGELRDPVHFWAKAEKWPSTTHEIEEDLREEVLNTFPGGATDCEVRNRRAGLGSLGRPRYVFVAMANGGRVARETKALAPSAAVWAEGDKREDTIHYQTALDKARRCPEPYVRVWGAWLIRRLAPDCSRIELTDIPTERDEAKLVTSMGYETANIHVATPDAIDKVLAHLRQQPKKWLKKASSDMAGAVLHDFERWQKEHRPRSQA